MKRLGLHKRDNVWWIPGVNPSQPWLYYGVVKCKKCNKYRLVNNNGYRYANKTGLCWTCNRERARKFIKPYSKYSKTIYGIKWIRVKEGVNRNKYFAILQCNTCHKYKMVEYLLYRKHMGNNNDYTYKCNICTNRDIMKDKTKEKNQNWKGGIYITEQGYRMMSIYPDDKWYKYSIIEHKRCGTRRMLEHRYIMMNHLCRPLEKWEHVHHIDGNKLNNSIDNLEVLPNIQHGTIVKMQEEIIRLKKLCGEL